MIIKSQNKLKMLMVPLNKKISVEIQRTTFGGEISYSINFEDEYENEFAIYSTKEKAIKALELLCKRLTLLQNITEEMRNNIYHYENWIFEFPEDEDV